jgi:flagellar protein FlaG
MRIEGMDASISKVSSYEQDNTVNNSDVRSIGNSQPKAVTTELPKSGQYSEKDVIEAIEKANKAISSSNRVLEFSIHERTKEIMVKVVDSETKEVIREIPPEKVLDMVAKLWELAGILVDERR